MTFRTCWTLLQSHIALIAALICVILAGFELRSSRWASPGYVLVIDCGSTGTRLHAYQWQDKTNRLPLLRPISIRAASHKGRTLCLHCHGLCGCKRAYERVETEPGLDGFLHDLPGVKDRALGPLLEWAAAVSPHTSRRPTPVFLLGTAAACAKCLRAPQRLLKEAQSVLEESLSGPPWGTRIRKGIRRSPGSGRLLSEITYPLPDVEELMAPKPLAGPDIEEQAQTGDDALDEGLPRAGKLKTCQGIGWRGMPCSSPDLLACPAQPQSSPKEAHLTRQLREPSAPWLWAGARGHPQAAALYVAWPEHVAIGEAALDSRIGHHAAR
ncbi:hypothetical protein WJX84_008998 [Apatococcus fuscideae]|uniref:Uncharacterized protein n=1 Tax=Apatococcus fuscideae TaxID=2026836 RepID=A0AAW1SUX8_9CHLO